MWLSHFVDFMWVAGGQVAGHGQDSKKNVETSLLNNFPKPQIQLLVGRWLHNHPEEWNGHQSSWGWDMSGTITSELHLTHPTIVVIGL